jgi:hypothetical protein
MNHDTCLSTLFQKPIRAPGPGPVVGQLESAIRGPAFKEKRGGTDKAKKILKLLLLTDPTVARLNSQS